MKDHKIRQEFYHKTESPNDSLGLLEVVTQSDIDEDELINQIVNYFITSQYGQSLLYPAKSYAVAIIYSELLKQFFNEEFYTSLNDPNLLYSNDQHFVPYKQAKDVYDRVLAKISLDFDLKLPQIQSTMQYFIQEFYLFQNPYFPSSPKQ